MRKDLLYFEIEYFKNWQTIGSKHLSTLKQWVYFIEKAILLFKDRNFSLYKYFLSTKLHLSIFFSYEKKPYQKIEKIEILDIKKEEDFSVNSLYKSKELLSNITEKTERKNKFIAKTNEEIRTCKSSSNIMILNQNVDKSPSIRSPYSNKKSKAPKVKFSSFDILRLLGSGTFGKVFLVRKKDDKKVFAMKVLKKKDLILKKHLKYAVTESNILKKCNHPFILRIHYSFQVI